MSPTCEICESSEACLAGTCPCDLCGEFIADVPRATANVMLEKLRVQERALGMLDAMPTEAKTMRDLLVKMFSGWILHEASYVPREEGPGSYSITLEEAMTEACAGDAREGILLSLFGHWSNDVVSMAAHYGVGLARRQPDGTMLHEDGTVDTLLKGGQLTMIVVPPPPSPAHYWSAGAWQELEVPEPLPVVDQDASRAEGGI